ncbi:type IV secretory system conjugative DNA transfer family protein [Muricoccus pecuniae]|uniref:Type IV secretion system protein VirD4 n=1 Tax=Muricoccus pecuniae TaxID=693023 RepID=A0A840YBG2_9PROT|nr:type IV secretory system conjugative DNA transfer family protein [Roseomonas pecuniae]MBB5696049.1 type IV secretion system protein VirD4 [Roseomonas pecuniae]
MRKAVLNLLLLPLVGGLAAVAWLVMASLLFLYGVGLWGHPELSWWEYPWAWWRYAPYAGRSWEESVAIAASALFAFAPLLALGRWQWRRWGGVAGMARKGLGIDRIRRGTTNNHGSATFMNMAEAAKLFPSTPDPDLGGVVVGEAERVDLGPVARVRFVPGDRETWGNGGRVPLLIDPCKSGTTHSIVIAGGGAYKSTTLVTSLLTWKKSRVVLDPSTELSEQVGAALAETGQQVVRLGIGDVGPNVLEAIDIDDDMAETRLRAVVGRIIGPMPDAGSGGGDGTNARFKQWGRTIVTALLAHMLWDDEFPAELKTLRTLRAGLSVSEERMRDRLRGIHETSPSPLARSLAGSMMGLADVTFSGAFGNATDDTEWLASEVYGDLVSGDAFRMSDLVRGNLSVFVQVPMEALRETPAVARVLVGSLLDAVFAANGKVNGRVAFFLDEAVLLGPMNALETARDQGRKYKVTLQLFYQSEGQIEKVWGRPGKDAWFDGVSWRTYAGIQNLNTAKDLSATLGTYGAVATSKGENKGRSGRILDLPTSSVGANLNEHEISREVAKPHELLQEMRGDERITLPRGERPIRHGAAIGFRRPAIAARLRETSYTATWEDEEEAAPA